MRFIDGPPCPSAGPALLARIARLQSGQAVHLVRWRWMLNWWDNRRKPRRRGTPVS